MLQRLKESGVVVARGKQQRVRIAGWERAREGIWAGSCNKVIVLEMVVRDVVLGDSVA